MIVRVAQRALARKLRARGDSFREIRDLVGEVPKSTLSYWLRDISLTPQQRLRLIEKARTSAERGSQKGALVNREKRLGRRRRARHFARRSLETLSSSPLFQTGVILYACEGSRTSNCFSFSNSDPRIIQVMMRWLLETCSVPAESIIATVYTHRMYEDRACKAYWQRVTGLPLSRFAKTVYKPTPHTVRKNPSFVGCCRLVVHKTDFFFVIKAWQALLLNQLVNSDTVAKGPVVLDIWKGILQIPIPPGEGRTRAQRATPHPLPSDNGLVSAE